jgi:guanosine-3',5'-bis(diphosphate) 3'-pyrophosphohydrolase
MELEVKAAAGPGGAVGSVGRGVGVVGASDAGIELESALAVVVPMEAGIALPLKDLDEPSGSFVSDGDGDGIGPVESSASHLAGSSVEAIHEVDLQFEKLLKTLHENRPGDDLEIVRKAWAFCLQQHEGQKRASGEPYVIHPLEVGQVLAELKMDSTAVAAGRWRISSRA